MDLTPAQLHKEWTSGNFRPVYYLFGEEESVKAAALCELKKLFGANDFNCCEFSSDAIDPAAIIGEATTAPAFSTRRLVIVGSHKIPAEARAQLTEYLTTPMPTTTLVLMSNDRKPDTKDALARIVSRLGGICVFGPLGEDEARQRIQRTAAKAGKLLSNEAATLLLSEVGTEWTMLKKELEKILLFCGDTVDIPNSAVAACLGYRQAADPFALTRLIYARALKACLLHIGHMMDEGKAEDQAFRALSQIASAVAKQYRAKRMLREHAAPELILRTLRLHAYYDKDFLSKVSQMSEARLLEDIQCCLKTESALKSQTWLDPRGEIEQLTAALCVGQDLAAAS